MKAATAMWIGQSYPLSPPFEKMSLWDQKGCLGKAAATAKDRL
jgi:hypothetical protein